MEPLPFIWRQNQSLSKSCGTLKLNFVAEAPKNTPAGNFPAWEETVHLSYLIAAMALFRLGYSIISLPCFVLRG
jgi:hypothetical protein